MNKYVRWPGDIYIYIDIQWAGNYMGPWKKSFWANKKLLHDIFQKGTNIECLLRWIDGYYLHWLIEWN